jgi:putative oxidoreductase
MTTHTGLRSTQVRTTAHDIHRLTHPQLPYDIGLLLLRLTVGPIMVAHGTQKLFGWFGGPGLEGTASFFKASGYPAAKTLAILAALAETGGGLGLALGLLTPLAGAAVLVSLVNAIGVKWNGGLFAPAGFEYELLLAVSAGALCLMGAGALALDRAIPPLRQHRLTHGAIAALLGVLTAALFLILRH